MSFPLLASHIYINLHSFDNVSMISDNFILIQFDLFLLICFLLAIHAYEENKVGMNLQKQKCKRCSRLSFLMQRSIFGSEFAAVLSFVVLAGDAPIASVSQACIARFIGI